MTGFAPTAITDISGAAKLNAGTITSATRADVKCSKGQLKPYSSVRHGNDMSATGLLGQS